MRIRIIPTLPSSILILLTLPALCATIPLINAEAGTNYMVEVNVTSQSVQGGRFHLHPEGNPGLYTIPYDLFFGQDLVKPGNDIRWSQLLQNSEKLISVSGINPSNAEQAPSGLYKDRITVNIALVD